MMSEHRALDDTKLSCELFLYYLSRVSALSDREKALWKECARKDESRSIHTIMDIAHIDATEQYSFPYSTN